MSRLCRKLVGVFVALALVGWELGMGVSYAQTSCGGSPPRAKPQRRKAGESFAPLPLPVTPLRRTEKKRPPSPPPLVGKMEYGKVVWATDSRGRRYSYLDWMTDPQDINNLLRWTNAQLGIKYKPITTKFNTFSYDPAEIPILYLSGHQGFQWTDEYRKEIRWFLQDGGYLIGDPCCGSKAFTDSFVKEISTIFPNRQLKRLESDHPVFSCFYQIKKIQYKEGRKKVRVAAPYLLGVSIGCRTCVFFMPYDMSCGWDGHDHDKGPRIGISDARRLGANIITYCLANYQLGRFLSTEKVYYQKGERTRDEFVFGQVIHGGDWDPDPSAVANLLKYVGSHSTMEVQFKRSNVDLRKPTDALQYPFLYMTGHGDFRFTEQEVASLRRYLTNGGVLLADACCGRTNFDLAFHREMKRVLPGKQLAKLPPSHPVYSAREKIRSVRYTELVRQTQPGLNTPQLEGISLGGTLCVVYSPYDLGCGWEEQIHPYSKGYSSRDALKIGMNVLVYSMTH